MDRVETAKPDEGLLDYHWRRADQELRFAELSKDVSARQAHLQLARWHQERCRSKH